MTGSTASELFSLGPIVVRHYRALGDPKSGVVGLRVWGVLVGVPLVAGGFAGGLVWGGLDVRDGVSQVLAATALLVGAMLSLFVFITNLRVKVAESSVYRFRTRLNQLLGGTAAGCLYVAVATMLLAGLLGLVASVDALRSPVAQPWVVGGGCALLLHIALTLASVVRRLFGVYFELFAADFNPAISAVPPADQVDVQSKRIAG